MKDDIEPSADPAEGTDLVDATDDQPPGSALAQIAAAEATPNTAIVPLADDVADEYEEFLAWTGQVDLGKHFSFLSDGTPLYRVTDTDEGIAKLLCERYDFFATELRRVVSDAAGVFTVDRDDDGRPQRIRPPDGMLLGTAATALKCAIERGDADVVQEHLFVCGGMRDVLILGMLGCKAVESKGLNSLTRKDLDNIFAGDPGASDQWRYPRLILVDFSVADLADVRAPEIQPAIQKLADAQDAYDFDLARRFSRLRPTPGELHRIARAASFHDRAAALAAIENCAESKGPRGWFTYPEQETTLTGAKARLRRVGKETPANLTAVQEARDAYRAAVDKHVIAAAEDMVEGAHDPFDKAALDCAVLLLREQFESAPEMLVAEQILSGSTPAQNGPLDDQFVKRLLTRQKALRELRQWTRDSARGNGGHLR